MTGTMTLLRAVAVAAIVILTITVFGCRTAPTEAPDPLDEIEGNPELVDLPADGRNMQIRLGGLDPTLVEAVLVRVSPPVPTVPEPRRVVPRLVADALSFDLPLQELEDGTTVEFAFALLLTNGLELPLQPELTMTLQFGIPAPQPLREEVLTIEDRPLLAWESAGLPARGLIEGLTAIDLDDPDAGSMRPPGPLVAPEQIAAGTQVSWRVRHRSPEGVLGPWSRDSTFLWDLQRSVPAVRSATDGDASVVSRPGLVWDEVEGADRYRLEYWFDPAGEDRRAIETESVAFRLPAGELEDPALLETGELFWRVQGLHDPTTETPFTEVQRLRLEVLVSAVVPVLPPEVEVVLAAGQTDPQDTLLNRPFGMSRHILTNAAAAELFNQGLRRGQILSPDEGDQPGRLVERATGFPLIALDQLDFGSQFGLRWDGESRTVSVIDQYRGHPAVGITWYGAVWLMNRLSLLEARTPVYTWLGIGSEDEIALQVDLDGDGYRLPTEAEWALAATQLQRSWPERVVEARPLSAREVRGANYLRSGDPWEDPLPPYTRAGGPTNPVGALALTTPAGLHDMLGNVWEWTGDWFDPRYPSPEEMEEAGEAGGDAPPQLRINPVGPPRGIPDVYGQLLRTVRGGAWNTPRERLAVTARGGFNPASASHSIGVRPARTITP